MWSMITLALVLSGSTCVSLLKLRHAPRATTAYLDQYEHGGVWTRQEYDAWLFNQTNAWLVVYNESEASISEEASNPPHPHGA